MRSRLEAIGSHLPETEEALEDLLARMAHPPTFDYCGITGIRSRHVHDKTPGSMESSFVLARRAALDCLSRSRYQADDLDLLISTSITRFEEGYAHRYEPSFAFMLARELGAKRAIHFDLSNACAGMCSGVTVLDRMIRSGAVRNGLVVSGECITPIADTAAREIDRDFDPQFASLSVGDAGAAVIMDASHDSADAIHFAEIITCAKYADLCIGKPSDKDSMPALYTNNKDLHNPDRFRIWPAYQKKMLAESGLTFAEEAYDFVIHHQVGRTVIDRFTRVGEEMFDAPMPPSLEGLEHLGNTASTSHFVVLHEQLKGGGIPPGSKVLLVPAASGVVTGFISLTLSSLEA